MKAMSTTQMKKKAVSKGRKTLGTVLLVLGIILLFAFAANTVASFTTRSFYEAGEHMSAAGTCAVLGGLFTGLGIRFRKKQRK